MARDDVSMPIAVDDIDVPSGHREVNNEAVKRLAKSIDKIGLRHPITVRRKAENRYLLVAGLHRLEAFKILERDYIPATVVIMTKDEARMWEISENLHRADLTKLQRDEQIAEWIELCENNIRQVDENTPRRVGRPGAVSAAADEIDVSEPAARRAIKVASISEQAKEKIREARLDNNRSAMLEVAKEKTPARQVAKVIELASPRDDADVIKKQFNDLMNAWNRACKEARDEFLLRIESPIMDERFA